jgi:hypothetical protein
MIAAKTEKEIEVVGGAVLFPHVAKVYEGVVDIRDVLEALGVCGGNSVCANRWLPDGCLEVGADFVYALEVGRAEVRQLCR